jgi:hypothetical protein
MTISDDEELQSEMCTLGAGSREIDRYMTGSG